MLQGQHRICPDVRDIAVFFELFSFTMCLMLAQTHVRWILGRSSGVKHQMTDLLLKSRIIFPFLALDAEESIF